VHGRFSGACLVAAYHGGGRRDYATPVNGFWVEPGDSFGLVDRVAAALRCPPETAAAMTAAGQAAARYTPGAGTARPHRILALPVARSGIKRAASPDGARTKRS